MLASKRKERKKKEKVSEMEAERLRNRAKKETHWLKTRFGLITQW